jgi:dienelactone hydrolase
MKKLCVLVLWGLLAGSATAQIPFSRGADGNWSDLSKWRANYGSGWGAATNFPGVNDSVTVNNDRVLNLDVNTQVSTVQLVNNTASAVLNVNGANTLTASVLNVGHATQTGTATVNQSAGTVYSTTAVIGGAGTGTYSLTGGTLSLDGTTTINSPGTLNINGGTLTSDHEGTDISITGEGFIQMMDGLWNSAVSAAAPQGDVLITDVDVAISGGTVELTGQNYFTGEFRVIGNSATISIDRLNNNAANHGDFVFEFDADGVSTIDSSGSWISLDSATVTVDGSAYTGGTGVFTLFQAANLASTSTAVTVTNFSGNLTATVTQDVVSGTVVLTIAEEGLSDLKTVAALGGLTNAPALRTDDFSTALAHVSPGEMKAVFFDALDYTGSPTRVYAYIGIPAGASSGNPVPGVVLVHGGGGTAFSDWVELWTNRGCAAISIAVEGQTDATNAPVMNTGWHIHNMPGPVRNGIYGDSDVTPIADQWMYHAVADTVLANSLLRSLPEVDADNIGIMGVSWGGVITSTAIGIDDRFRFAIPTYGCGNKSIAENIYGDALGDNDLYKEVWDPMVRITKATMPVLWFSWPQEWHFPLNCQRDTYAAAPGPHMVSLVPGMNHGHAAAWNRPESYAFADSIISNGAPWCVQQSAMLTNGTATVVFQCLETLDSASLISTIDWGLTGDRTWTESPAVLVTNGGGSYTVTADLPSEYTTAWFVNVGSGPLISSSDFQENADVIPPSNIVYNVSTNWSSKTVKANDTVTITNGATVSLDTNAAASALTVNAGTLLMDQNDTLALSGALAIDAYGSIVLNDGTLLPGGVITVDGDITLNGGALYRDIAATGCTVSGDGVLTVRSGTVAFTNGAPTDILELNTDLEISGGLVDLDGQIYIGRNTPAECTVIGDDAVIQIERLNQGPGGNSGTFRFVLDETGVSTMNISAWMNLANLTLDVDGSAYAGGAANLLLLDAVNLSVLADTNRFSVSGFAQNGLIASVVQDQTDGKDWVQLVIEAHTPTTVTFSSSADWSSFPMFGNDDVVIESGAAVTVDAEAFANHLQLDGNLLLKLGMTGFAPMTLGGITVGTSGSIIVDGSDYEGFDGYFPLLDSASLTAALTNHVLFAGFGAREPAVVVQDDGLWLRLIAPPSLSERLCSLVPESTVAPAWFNSSFSATRTYDPSGSAWTPTFSEAHVMDTRLSHIDAENEALSWDLRLARGGNIYSLRTPLLGETVPPSYRSDTNSSPWNDEVWQGVAVDSSQNDVAAGSGYFTHQSGVYLRDPALTEPFYVSAGRLLSRFAQPQLHHRQLDSAGAHQHLCRQQSGQQL